MRGHDKSRGRNEGLVHSWPWLHTVGAKTAGLLSTLAAHRRHTDDRISQTLNADLEDSEQDQQARPAGQGGRHGGSLTLRAGNWETGWRTGCSKDTRGLKGDLKDRDLVSHG